MVYDKLKIKLQFSLDAFYAQLQNKLLFMLLLVRSVKLICALFDNYRGHKVRSSTLWIYSKIGTLIIE